MENAIKLHKKLKGKLEIKSKVGLSNKNILSLIYTPGVAEIVKSIQNNPGSVYDLSIKNNTIAVITDGSAVLGLGKVGAEAALPVMEGKCAIFKEFSGLNAFPICLKTQGTNEIIKTINNISPVFAAINLEDVSAPRCFEIEKRLQNLLPIPVMHDDQHATAIIVLAGLLNAANICRKELKRCRIVINGVGAAGTATAKLLISFGCRNLLLVDSRGIIFRKRGHLDTYKKELAKLTNIHHEKGDLLRAVGKADILIGLSKKNLFTRNVIRVMNPDPIVFALANPDPEITENDAKKWGIKVYANGRSDCKNQINNALVFPGFFKALLIHKLKVITQSQKINVARAIARLISNPTPDHFIPSIFNPNLVSTITKNII